MREHTTISETRKKATPVVLVFAGHDPSNGAGIGADIQAIASLGAHAATLITANTVQNTRLVSQIHPVDSGLLFQQANTLLADLPVAAIKIGLIGSVENAYVIRDILKSRPEIPVVLDPVINAGTGQQLTDPALLTLLQQALLPLTTVLTPNSLEADQLAPYCTSRQQCAEKILATGVRHVVITGTHDETAQVINHYYDETGEHHRFRWPRLDYDIHGSGCTLASSIAALIASGHTVLQAVTDAQSYTWQSLKHAEQLGQGQHMARRLYWGHALEKNTHDTQIS